MNSPFPRFILPALLIATFLVSGFIHRSFIFPFPPLNILVFDLSEEFKNIVSFQRPLGSEAGYRDFAGVLMGMRRFTADIAWISVLQYYGAHEMENSGDEEGHRHEFTSGDYPALQKMVRRVIRLDPSNYHACEVGGGALAFNLNRPKEGLEILEEGIQYNPTYWRFRLLVGAIVYKQQGKFSDMIALLEDAIRYPDCPTMIKSILANIYKQNKNYLRALQIWIEVYENERTDPWYREQAVRQITDLRDRLGI